MVTIINLQRTDADGKLIPSNNPNYAIPSYIKYAQLRYNTFSDSYAVQGIFLVTGESSTVQFDLSSVSVSYTLFKLYLSMDGVTYTEDRTYGGTLGRTIFTGIAGAVMLTGAQTINSVKTFTALPESAVTPTTANQLTRKGYVDARTGSSMKIIVNQGSTSAPAVKIFFNNTNYAVTTTARNDTGDYTINFNGNIFGDQSKISLEYKTILFDNSVIAYAVDIPYTGLSNTSLNLQTYQFYNIGPENLVFVAVDSILTQYVITINIEP